jgi:hypothetical protein
LGLQIGLNFVPATKTETRDGGQTVIFVGTRLSFFVAKNVRTAGSLTSTYRVVRNTTLRAESEIKTAVASAILSGLSTAERVSVIKI